MKRIFLILLTVVLCKQIMVAQSKKREFRGAWIQAVNGQWTGVGRDQMQRTLTYQLDELQKDGVNAIFFQVRPECDALYQSSIEPWSRFLTAQQGRAPQPYWDPLEVDGGRMPQAWHGAACLDQSLSGKDENHS